MFKKVKKVYLEPINNNETRKWFETKLMETFPNLKELRIEINPSFGYDILRVEHSQLIEISKTMTRSWFSNAPETLKIIFELGKTIS